MTHDADVSQVFDEVLSAPIDVCARELGTNIPRSKVMPPETHSARVQARSHGSASKKTKNASPCIENSDAQGDQGSGSPIGDNKDVDTVADDADGTDHDGCGDCSGAVDEDKGVSDCDGRDQHHDDDNGLEHANAIRSSFTQSSEPVDLALQSSLDHEVTMKRPAAQVQTENDVASPEQMDSQHMQTEDLSFLFEHCSDEEPMEIQPSVNGESTSVTVDHDHDDGSTTQESETHEVSSEGLDESAVDTPSMRESTLSAATPEKASEDALEEPDHVVKRASPSAPRCGKVNLLHPNEVVFTGSKVYGPHFAFWQVCFFDDYAGVISVVMMSMCDCVRGLCS